MNNSHERLKILKRASWIGILGNLFLSGLKVGVGVLSGSLAVIGDGIDSISDVVTSLVTLYASKAAAAPPDPEHPWGHGRVETIATKTLSLIIVMAGLQLALLSGRKLMGWTDTFIPTQAALVVTGVSILGKALLATIKFQAAKKTQSRMMRADAMNMRNDILLSFTVLAGLLFTQFLNLPILDVLFGLGISIWIIVSGLRIFLHANTELMDSVEDREVYRQVFAATEKVPGVQNPHRVRIRRLNALYVVDLDVEVDGNLTVEQAHALACQLEKEICASVGNIYDIMVHIEPEGCEIHQEGYGLVPDDVREIHGK